MRNLAPHILVAAALALSPIAAFGQAAPAVGVPPITVPGTLIIPPATPAGQQQLISGTPWVNGHGLVQGPNWRDNYQIIHDILAGMGTWDANGAYTPRLPAGGISGALAGPTATVLGGVLAATAPANQFQNGIGTDGKPTFAQPSFGNISGVAGASQGGTGATTPAGALASLGGLSKAGDTVLGPMNVLVNPSITPFSGKYATNGSLDWNLTANGIFTATDPTINAPDVIGTGSLQSNPPFTDPNKAISSRTQMLINTRVGDTHPSWGVFPFEINFDDSPALGALITTPNNDVEFQGNMLIAPTGGQGDCSKNFCISGWGMNIDLKVRGSQGQIMLAVQNEADYNNSYQGKDAFQVNQWLTYGGDYPIIASIYSTNQFTDNYTGTATVSGSTVTWTSGFKFDPDLTYMLTIGGQLVRVASVAACNPAPAGHQLCSTTLTLQKAPTTQGTNVSFSWAPAAATYGVLFADAPTTPLNQTADFLANDMAYYGIVLGGHHYIDFSSGNEATDGTGAPYFGSMNSGQKLCFSGLDACRNQYTNGAANVLQDISSGGVVFDELGVSGATSHIRVTDAVGGSGGPLLSAVGTDTNVSLNFAPQGTGLLVLNGPVVLPATPVNSGAGTKGSLCLDNNGLVFVKTTAGACL